MFFNAEVAPYIDDGEETGKITPALWPKAAEIGLLQLGYPEQYGRVSEGIDQFFHSIVWEEFTRAGSAGRLISTLLIHSIGLPPVVNFAQDTIKELVIPGVLNGSRRICIGITEPSGGSDVANIQPTAKLAGDSAQNRGDATTYQCHANLLGAPNSSFYRRTLRRR